MSPTRAAVPTPCLFIKGSSKRAISARTEDNEQAVQPNGSGAFCGGSGDFWLAVGSLWCWSKIMKLHGDPTAEFADLATTKYQRYVLYRLESSAQASPWRYIVAWGFLVMPAYLLRPDRFGLYDDWWYTGIFTFLSLLAIGEIYFSRAVLSMWRRVSCSKEKIDQQVVGCNRRLRPSLNSGSPPPVHPL